MISQISKWVVVCAVVLAGMVRPVSAAVITVGASGADYTNFDAALGAAGANDTIRFIDSDTYTTVNILPVNVAGLTIESAAGQRATLSITNKTGPTGQYYGFLNNQDNTTLNNLDIWSQRTTAIATGGGRDLTVTNVSFTMVNDDAYGGPNGIEAWHGMTVAGATFYGASALGKGTGYGGRGVSLSNGATNVVVRHCSFDQLHIPIYNPYAAAATTATITDCAFGVYHGATWAFAITVADEGGGQVYEDYNGAFRDDAFSDVQVNGGHSVDVSVYADVFTGDTSAGDWSTGPALFYAASDGTTIGAWQRPELTVGAGGNYAHFLDALAAATAPNDTIRFLDSATYAVSNNPYLSIDGLTIMSEEGQRATLDFTGPGGSYYGMIVDADHITVSNMIVRTSERSTLVALAGGTNSSFSHANFINTGGGTGVESSKNGTFEYCTFYGAGAAWGGGAGISWSSGTAISVNHCSFDNLETGIYNPARDAATELTLSNSAFGTWVDSRWRGGFTLNGDPVPATVAEDYNASYGPRVFITGPSDGNDVSVTTSGGNSVHYGYGAGGSYSDVFTGATVNGDWTVASALYTAAGDGTTIGAWQFVATPVAGTLIMVH